jgi:hypothetical protein
LPWQTFGRKPTDYSTIKIAPFNRQQIRAKFSNKSFFFCHKFLLQPKQIISEKKKEKERFSKLLFLSTRIRSQKWQTKQRKTKVLKQGLGHRVARWHILKPKILICVFTRGTC